MKLIDIKPVAKVDAFEKKAIFTDEIRKGGEPLYSAEQMQEYAHNVTVSFVHELMQEQNVELPLDEIEIAFYRIREKFGDDMTDSMFDVPRKIIEKRISELGDCEK